MPDLEISIPSKSKSLLAARVLTILSFPVWGVFAPFLVVVSLVFMGFSVVFWAFSPYKNFSDCISALYLLSGLCLGLATMYVGIRSVVVFGDKNITMNDKGISFPANFLPDLRFRRHRKWNDLGKIAVIAPNKIEFSFISGGTARLKLSRFSSEQQEKLLLGLNAWAAAKDSEGGVAALLEKMQDPTVQSTAPGYTKLWEEQMNRHFASTAFVPLQNGALLQNGRIKVVGPIAFGGLSAVYMAQLKSAETVILKELVTDDVSDNEILQKSMEMFRREAEILMKLSDPRIANVLDHFSENGRSYLLLEYIQGENLRNVISHSGARSEAQAIEWALQIAEILKYIHGQNPPVIHRDLTPDNLVLRDGRQIVLIDFGAANTFLGTATGTLVGKQSYISPEQFRGKTVVQSDFYALGASLYFLLTGQEPEPLSQSRPRNIRPELSREVDDFVAECTAFDTNARPATAGEVVAKLEELQLKLRDTSSSEFAST